MMKYFNIIIFVFLTYSGFAQWSVSGGYPRTFPTQTQYAKNHIDSISGRTFFFRHPKWFMRGDIVQSGTPADSVYFVSTVGIVTVSYDSCQWYNLTSQSYWKKIGGAWQNTQGISLDSLLSRNNTWTGKNRFTDSLKADKGLTSGGVVDTKGVSTIGSSTQSAMQIQGAIAEKDTIIDTNNFQMTWNYGIYSVKTLTGDRIVKLPVIGSKNDWTQIIKNETLDVNGYTLFIHSDTNVFVYKLTGKISIKFKIKNLSWVIESVSTF